MKTLDDSVALAKALVAIGKGVGLKCMAVISDMNQPLGYKVGNSLEIEESIDVLKGKGPEDVKELMLTLGSYMVVLGGKAADAKTARRLLEEAISSGKALDRFRAMIKAQGGDERVIDDYSLMPQAKYKIELPAKQSGVVEEIKADEVGIASMMLGGGRQKAGDQLDYSVGIELKKKVGDEVKAGESLLTIYSNRPNVDDIKDLLYQNIAIADHADKKPMIYRVIE